MGIDNWLLIGRLRRAVKKISFLLNFNLNRWRIASAVGNLSRKRRVSFNDRLGLRAACGDDSDLDARDSPNGTGALSRTMSCRSSDDDIDKRAEMFISNFYRQLRMERQVSLELRYCRGNSFGSTSP